MKKLNYLMSLFAVAAMAFLVSCKGEEEVVIPAPSITLSETSATVDVGVDATFSYTVVSEGGVQSLSVTKDGTEISGKSSFSADELNGFTYSETYTPTQDDANKTLLFTITVTDVQGQTASADYSLTVNDPATPITAYTAKLLGGQSNATEGSFMSVSDGTIYLIADAKANSEKVDFVYFFGATNKATIAAPTDEGAKAVFGGTNGPASWTTQNNTDFKLTSMTATEFDAITDGRVIESTYDNGTVYIDPATEQSITTRANQLQVGSVRAFQTVSGKKGLFKVTALSEGGSGSLTIDVKIPQ